VNKRLVIIGTAHVSAKSVQDVKDAIESERPQAVAVELDLRRYKALTEGTREDIDIISAIKSGQGYLLLFQILLSYFQRKMGEEYGIKPGAEMLAAIEKAKEIGADILLIDRDIAITMRRFWSSLGFVEKLRFIYELIKGIFGGEDLEVDEMLEDDILKVMMKEFRSISPRAAKVLIDERDAYMAGNLLKALVKYDSVVAVVGAGHKEGIENFLRNPDKIPPINELEKVDTKRFSVFKLISYTILAIVLLIFAAVISTMNTEIILKAFAIWFLANGILSAAGAAIAGAHPFSILAAFLSAWMTSLNPAIAAGWVSGLVEAWIRKPGAKDIEALSKAQNIRELLRNKLFRILLVAAFTNIGSMAGTIIGGYYAWKVTGIDVAAIIKERVLTFFRL
jgi:pheromone shutdown-related protein TraB